MNTAKCGKSEIHNNQMVGVKINLMKGEPLAEINQKYLT